MKRSWLLSLFLLPALILANTRLPELDPALFLGIDDNLVLPLLRTLYEKPGCWNVAPQDGRFLYDLILQKKYTRGLEIGTSSGYSTLWLGLAFRNTGGKIITIEKNRGQAAVAKENFQTAQLDKVIESRVSDAALEIQKLQGSFDFIYIDASKANDKKFLERILTKLSPGGAIVTHNVVDENAQLDSFLWSIKTNKSLQTQVSPNGSPDMSISFKVK
jgi:predicted O-methyltransferase YrrM